jgi:RimJ/RimL family protein N-acetyltransferase
MPDDTQPVGPPVADSPASRPAAVALPGRCCRIEKLDPAAHGDALWHALSGHDRVWTYLAFGPFSDRGAFGEWLSARAASADPFCFAVCDPGGVALGMLSLLEIRPAMRVIEVGSIVYAPALQRSAAGTEAQFLLARHVFEALGYRRYEWKCNVLNAPSLRAAPRLGFTFEGIFRQHMIVKGRSRDTAWFAMLDHEWPARRLAFERWLAPDNFDDAGRQRAGLSALNAGIARAPPQ